MIILNQNNRRTLQRLSDKLNQLAGYDSRKEKMRIDHTLWMAVEMLFVKSGELMKRFRDKCSDVFSRTPIFKSLTGFRDKLAHTVDTDVEKVIQAFHALPILRTEVNKLLEESFSEDEHFCNFELFGGVGSQKERKRYVDALVAKLSDDEIEDPISFPSGQGIARLSKITEAIIGYSGLIKLCHDHPKISKEIAQDIVKWATHLYKNIMRNNRFEREENMLYSIQQFELIQFCKKFPSIKKELSKNYKNSDINLSFFSKKNRELLNDLKDTELSRYKRNKIASQQKALRTTFLNDWESQLNKRRVQHELQLIETSRIEFTKELYRKLEDFQKLKTLLEPFINNLGKLWDISGGIWKKTGFEFLRKYAGLLEQDQSLIRLAEILGQYNKSKKEFEEERYESVVIKQKWKINNAIKAEYIGLKESDEISSMLPSEFALLSNSETQDIFLKKYAEKKLITFDYQGQELQTIQEANQAVRKNQKENKGPIIICIDTSGSMRGTPEQIAKVLCFALLKIAIRDKRKCFLISFSTSIQTLELSDLPNSLDKLVEFLSMSFHGGTNASEAMHSAIEMLNTNEYRKADILLVSDFIMPELDDTTKESIKNAKLNNTNFHSLTFNNSNKRNNLNLFDNNWVFNPNNKENMIELVKKMESMK